MRKFILIFSLFIFTAFNLSFAQIEDYIPEEDEKYQKEVDTYKSSGDFGHNTVYPNGIGGQIAWGGGINLRTAVPNSDNAFTLNNFPDIALSGYMTLSNEKNLGMTGELGLYKTSYGVYSGSNLTVNQIKYFYVGAAVYYEGAFAGLNYGFPRGGDRINPDNSSEDYASDLFSNLIEIKLGYTHTLWYNRNDARLNILFQIGYSITGIQTTDITIPDPRYQGDNRVKRFNYQPFQAKLGIQYIVNVQGNYL